MALRAHARSWPSSAGRTCGWDDVVPLPGTRSRGRKLASEFIKVGAVEPHRAREVDVRANS